MTKKNTFVEVLPKRICVTQVSNNIMKNLTKFVEVEQDRLNRILFIKLTLRLTDRTSNLCIPEIFLQQKIK